MARRHAPRQQRRPRAMRKRIARKKKAQAAQNKDTFFLKAQMMATLTPTQGITVANYLSWFPQLLNATSPYGVAQNAEFNFWCKLYDQVRVNSMTIHVVPKANVLDQTNAQNDGSYRVTGDGLIHHVIDRDSIGPQNINALQKYSSYRKVSVLKPWKRSYGIKYPTDVWLDTLNIFEDETLLKRLGANGGIYVYAENLLEDLGELINEPYATVYITYNCVFRGKTMGSLTFNEDGSVTLKSLDSLERAPETEPVVLTGVMKPKRYDLSGNVVATTDSELP